MSRTLEPLKLPKPVCVNCRFWKKWEKQLHDPGKCHYGDCRIAAPVNFLIDGIIKTRWPSTAAHDFCGKFAPDFGINQDAPEAQTV